MLMSAKAVNNKCHLKKHDSFQKYSHLYKQILLLVFKPLSMNIIVKNVAKRTFFLYEVLNDISTFPAFHEALKKRQDIVAMDVACGFPKALIWLNEVYKLSKAICVDERTEEGVVQEVAKQRRLLSKKKISEVYFEMGGGSINSIEEFDEVFSKHSYWGHKADYILQKFKFNADVLICQNFIHLFENEEVEEWIGLFSRHIKKDGIIILSVQSNNEFDYAFYKKTINKYFSGTIFEFYVNGNWEYSYFFNAE